MRRREFILAASAAAAWPLCARAEQVDRVSRIGLLFVNTAEQERAMFGDDPLGFGDLGYVEGKTAVFDRRCANGNMDRLAAQAQELVDLKVDVIVTAGPGVYAAHRATTTIPIVAGTIGDPVGQGFAASLAHPGGNITGSVIFAPEVLAKRPELLKQIVPSLKRVGVLVVHSYAANLQYFTVMAPTAKLLNIELLPIEVTDPNSYEDALSPRAAASIGGMAFTEPAQLMANAALIASLAITRGLPAVAAPAHASAAALLGYGVSQKDLFHNAAAFVDKILRGAKTGDIPFERATKFETVVNLKTAKALGLDIPAIVLAAADEVIE